MKTMRTVLKASDQRGDSMLGYARHGSTAFPDHPKTARNFDQKSVAHSAPWREFKSTGQEKTEVIEA
jgi:hypothetical protein